VGQLTRRWQLSASYTYLDGKTVKTVPGGPPLNSPLFNAPKNRVAIWTTYQLPYGIEVGGGLNSVSRRFASLTTTPFTSVPGYTTVDLLLKWQATRRIRVQVNINNLTDRYYYDQLHGFHVVPGEGRSALFTLAYSD
jgi:catecholate siderophore receptor